MADAEDIPDTPDSPNLKLTFSTQGRKKSLSRGQRSSEIVSFARTKSQSAWSSVKVKLMKQTSTPELWRKWSPRRLSEVCGPEAAVRAREARWPDDAEQSLFCESLLGVMKRCGRFDYISGGDDVKGKEKVKEKGKGEEEEKEMEKEKQTDDREEVDVNNDKDERKRRRSLLDPLRTNRNASNTL
ncbi:hypothetical protein MMC29_008557 [Sticta canariensis]|nr:hypothetical protein [Sticta canariensis]